MGYAVPTKCDCAIMSLFIGAVDSTLCARVNGLLEERQGDF